MFIAQSEIKYLATKSSCLVTSPHHYQIEGTGEKTTIPTLSQEKHILVM